MILILQTGTKVYSVNNTAKSSAYQLELCVLLPDTILSDQQICEEALGVLTVSIRRLIYTYLMSVSLEGHQFSHGSASNNTRLEKHSTFFFQFLAKSRATTVHTV